ncbi:MAG: patatin-like phospholipase family protein [Gordonia sp. (in: high G+C Gram-positive bacteria)]|uniref:patatin-like phospholipase family protein n=1 Tax=Gordonia sp. (in: high G+C Gram-positive bacteria) TaxID=84139 RepID=UPI003BB4C386
MKVALALGSGGARGYAHIGVIDELQARGHQIVGVAGSSMGALVGGMLAAGKLDEFSEWAQALDQRAVLKLVDLTLHAAGVLRAEKVVDAVRDILGSVLIEDLDVPFTAVATDLVAGTSAWLDRGQIADAIRASIAIPGIIAPHELDRRLLGDGGILDPTPTAPLAVLAADLTIAVDLSGLEPVDGDPLPQFSGLRVADRSIDIAQAALARHTLAAYPPDLLIEVPRTVCGTLEFHRAEEVIAVGREIAITALDAEQC